MLLKKNYYFKISFLIILFWVFSAPQFSFFHLFKINATNIFLTFPIIFYILQNFNKNIKIKKIYLILYSFLLISIILPSLISASPLSIFYGLILCIFIPFAFLVGYIIEANYLFNLFIYTSFINFFFSIIQIINPFFKWPSTHAEIFNYKEKPLSALSQYLPSIPSIGRIGGIYDENAPMVISLLIISSIIVLFYLNASNYHLNINDDFFVIDRYRLSKNAVAKIAIFFNLLISLFTGSKLILFFPFLLLLIYVELNLNFFRKIISSSRFFTIFLSIFFPLTIIGLIFYLSLDDNFTKLPFDLWKLPALKYRITLSPSIIEKITLFSGLGLQKSSSEAIDAINGFIIYLISFGPIFSISIYSLISFAILSSTNSITLLFLFYVNTITAGSMFNFSNTLFFIFLGVIESHTIRSKNRELAIKMKTN